MARSSTELYSQGPGHQGPDHHQLSSILSTTDQITKYQLELEKKYKLYTDPSTKQEWVSLPDGRFTVDKVAVEMAHVFRNQARAAEMHTWLMIRAHPAAGYVLDEPACCHSTMLNSVQAFESPQVVGRHIDKINYLPMTETLAAAWHQRIFLGLHPAEPRYDVRAAIIQKRDMFLWAFEDTIKARYIGLLIECPKCGMLCRISWNLKFSTRKHMYEQRNVLCAFLQAKPMAYVPQDSLPVV
jgi:hypothetical protein